MGAITRLALAVIDFIAKNPGLRAAALAKFAKISKLAVTESTFVKVAKEWVQKNPFTAGMLVSSLLELPSVASFVADQQWFDWSDVEGETSADFRSVIEKRYEKFRKLGLSTKSLESIGDGSPDTVGGVKMDRQALSKEKQLFNMIDRASAVAGSYANFMALRDALLTLEEEHFQLYEELRS